MKKWYLDKLNVIQILIVMTMLLSLFCLIRPVTALADDTETSSDASFYKISCAASEYYELTHTDHDSDDVLSKLSDFFSGTLTGGNWKDVEYQGDQLGWASAGAFMGYTDPDDLGDGIVGILSSALSGNTTTRSYNSLIMKDSSDETLRQYAEYGHAWAALGIDSTSTGTGLSDMGESILRIVGGLLLGIAYFICAVIELGWNVVLQLLRLFNPFQWIATGVTQFLGYSTYDTSGGISGALQGVAGLFKDWYQFFAELGVWCVTFTFLVLFMWCMMRGSWSRQTAMGRQSVGSVLIDYLKKISFVILGIPILGMAYTASLDYMALNSQNTPVANTVLYSTLVDFQSWVETSNLAIPDNVTLQVNANEESQAAGTVDQGGSSNPRYLARAINAASGVSGLGTISSDQTDMFKDTKSDSSIGVGQDNTSGYNGLLRGLSTLGSFCSNSTYSASSYESYYKANKLASNGKISSENVTKLVACATLDSWKKGGTTDKMLNVGDYPWFASYSGSASNGQNHPGSIKSGTANYYLYDKSKIPNGLSAISMYNYLNTKFGETTVVSYSDRNSTSAATSISHHSVNLIGSSGMNTVLTLLHSVTMLLVLGVVGLVYAFGLLLSMIGRGIKLLMSIPAAVLGTFKGMAKATTIAIMMIVEVLGTIFVYQIMAEVLMGFSSLLENGITDWSGSAVTATNGGAVDAGRELTRGFSTILLGVPDANNWVNFMALALPFVDVLCILFYVFFIIMAIKWRKSFIKAVDEGIGGLVDKYFRPTMAGDPYMGGGATGGAGGNGGGIMRNAAGSALAGAGMAAGNNAAKAVGDSAVGQAAKGGLKEGAKGALGGATKGFATGGVHGAAIGAAKGGAQGAIKGVKQGATKGVTDGAKDAAKEGVKGVTNKDIPEASGVTSNDDGSIVVPSDAWGDTFDRQAGDVGALNVSDMKPNTQAVSDEQVGREIANGEAEIVPGMNAVNEAANKTEEKVNAALTGEENKTAKDASKTDVNGGKTSLTGTEDSVDKNMTTGEENQTNNAHNTFDDIENGERSNTEMNEQTSSVDDQLTNETNDTVLNNDSNLVTDSENIDTSHGDIDMSGIGLTQTQLKETDSMGNTKANLSGVDRQTNGTKTPVTETLKQSQNATETQKQSMGTSGATKADLSVQKQQSHASNTQSPIKTSGANIAKNKTAVPSMPSASPVPGMSRGSNKSAVNTNKAQSMINERISQMK